jgi:hypothetical protein
LFGLAESIRVSAFLTDVIRQPHRDAHGIWRMRRPLTIDPLASAVGAITCDLLCIGFNHLANDQLQLLRQQVPLG